MRMKKIIFPLEMRDGKQVRELDEFQAYFDLGKAIEYFSNGRLQTWLESSYNDDILEEIGRLTGKEEDFVAQFTQALGVEVEEKEFNVQEELEKARVKEKLKRFYPEKTVGEMLPSAADSQESMERLLSKGCSKIFLLPGTYRIPVGACDVTFEGIQNPEVCFDAADRREFVKQRVRFLGVAPADENAGRFLQGDDLKDACAGLLDVVRQNLDKMLL